MGKYNRLYNLMTKIGEYPMVHIVQTNNLEFKIRVGGGLMKAFARLGEIQSEIQKEIGDDFTLKTIYGEGQDATFKFTEN